MLHLGMYDIAHIKLHMSYAYTGSYFPNTYGIITVLLPYLPVGEWVPQFGPDIAW